jgi:uncharacterized protein
VGGGPYAARVLLTPAEVRVLGCLVEKQWTTPDQYPLTRNALVLACNQSTNRDPIVSYDETLVAETLFGLQEQGLTRTVHMPGARVPKHRHVIDEAWGVDRPQLALLSVLMLRGPQTPGELKIRAERLHGFRTPEDVEATLGELAARSDPFVQRLERRPGQKEARWAHLLEGATPVADPYAEPASARHLDGPSSRASTGGGAGRDRDEVARLSDEVARLTAELAALRSDFEQFRAAFE